MSTKLKQLNLKSDSEWIRRAEELYLEAFPKIERIPFTSLLKCVEKGTTDLFAYFADSEFVGFAITLLPGNLAYLFYCAIAETKRSCGYGSAMVKDLAAFYQGRAMILDIEPLDPLAENRKQREKRYQFYSRLGFRDTGYEMTDKTGNFRILTNGKDFSLEEFRQSYDIIPESFEGEEILDKRDSLYEPVSNR